MKHCSNCGERIVEKHQFCRSCGAELVVDGQRRRIRPGTLIFGGLMATLFGAFVVLFGGFLESKTIAFIGSAFALLSFGVMVIGAFLADSSRRRRTAKTNTTENALEKADTTNRLPPVSADEHFPASVTERTTTKLRRN